MARITSGVFFIIAVLLEAACSDSVFLTHEIRVSPPPRPEAWLDLPTLSFSVTWQDHEGIVQQETIGEDDELCIRLRRGLGCGIIARAFSGTSVLRPAGAFYPRGIEGAKNSILELDYAAGYINEVALCLERMGKYPWIFPLEKVYQELLLKGVDPWAVPVYEAAEALAMGRFRIDRYDRKTLCVSLPGGVPWIPESPFCKIESDGASQKAFLADGLTVFLADGLKLLVLVKEGKVLFQIIPRDSD